MQIAIRVQVSAPAIGVMIVQILSSTTALSTVGANMVQASASAMIAVRILLTPSSITLSSKAVMLRDKVEIVQVSASTTLLTISVLPILR